MEMFHVNYGALTGMPTGMEDKLQACRACLATDTKLYRLRDGLAEAYEYLIGMPVSTCDGLPQHICNFCCVLLNKYVAFKDRCVAANRLMEAALLELQYQPITTDFVRSIDRMSHNLVLEFTLGLDSKVINIVHNDDVDDEVDLEKCIIQYDEHGKTIVDMDDTDGLTDVLNDFEEIRESLNEDDINFNNDFDDINDENDFDDTTAFNDHVQELLSGKVMNNDMDDLIEKNFNAKDINNEIVDMIKGEDTLAIEKSNFTAVKKALNEESSHFNDAEELLNANINDSLPEVINFNDVSINTTDLNENDNSNLVETFNNFILDHDYLDEKFLVDTGDSEMAKTLVIPKKDEDDLFLKEIIPTITKKDKKLIIKALEESVNKTIEKPKQEAQIDIDAFNKVKPKKLKFPKTNEEKFTTKPVITKMEIHDDFNDDVSNDYIKFGDEFNFKVFAMTRKEQMEEMEKKRESVLYLGAPYKCVKCAKGFRSEVTHKNHMKVHEPSYGMFECSICRSRHKTEARRRRHAETHRLRYCCTQCEFVARSKEKAEAHFEWHTGKTYSCTYCGEIFGKASTHLSHVRLRHPGACAACGLCGEAFVGARGLKLHTKRMHAPVPEVEDSIEFYCFTCRIQFKNQGAFKRHKLVSGRSCTSQLRPCEECGDNFESDESVLQHRRLCHVDAPVKCHLCDAVFSTSVSHQTHYERVHLNVRVKKQDNAIRVRSAARGSQERRKVVCEVCGKKYHSPAALSYHQRSHSGERPYPCPRCHKSFAFNHSLQAHIRTHTGERPYRCSQCARAFPNANNLARHKKTVHLGQKHYSRCSICLKWLTSPSAMKLHVATVHNHAPWPRKQNK